MFNDGTQCSYVNWYGKFGYGELSRGRVYEANLIISHEKDGSLVIRKHTLDSDFVGQTISSERAAELIEAYIDFGQKDAASKGFK